VADPLSDADNVWVVLFMAAQSGLAWRVIEDSDRTGCGIEDVLSFNTEEGDPGAVLPRLRPRPSVLRLKFR
jgi:hypothetical protein